LMRVVYVILSIQTDGIINLVILLDILGIVVYLLQTKGGWRS
jgi:hypothetical protein